MDEDRLRGVLRGLDPAARAALRRLLVADAESRDAIAQQLLRRRTKTTADLADLIDHLTLNPDARRRVARLLGGLEASRG